MLPACVPFNFSWPNYLTISSFPFNFSIDDFLTLLINLVDQVEAALHHQAAKQLIDITLVANDSSHLPTIFSGPEDVGISTDCTCTFNCAL